MIYLNPFLAYYNPPIKKNATPKAGGAHTKTSDETDFMLGADAFPFIARRKQSDADRFAISTLGFDN